MMKILFVGAEVMPFAATGGARPWTTSIRALKPASSITKGFDYRRIVIEQKKESE